jgi:hypothetical protein
MPAGEISKERAVNGICQAMRQGPGMLAALMIAVLLIEPLSAQPPAAELEIINGMFDDGTHTIIRSPSNTC